LGAAIADPAEIPTSKIDALAAFGRYFICVPPSILEAIGDETRINAE
jgi:hypothetical protein